MVKRACISRRLRHYGATTYTDSDITARVCSDPNRSAHFPNLSPTFCAMQTAFHMLRIFLTADLTFLPSWAW
jgi:hypothetical protein